jgi:hypothetical protein
MLTGIKHPIVFVVLVTADVMENLYCLLSLYLRLRGSRNKISPLDDHNNENDTEHHLKSLTKRTSSVYKLLNDMDDRETQGTILFIAATLLQREFVETIVPIQAFGVLTALYHADVNSNAIKSSWSGSEDYHNAMMYTGIDLGVELFVFVSTIITLNVMFPEVSPWRILSGLVRTNFKVMVLCMTFCWLFMFLFQCFYNGMDPTFRFEWVRCADQENATWNGGFDWDC